ncbi:cytochrome P450 [Polymorphobacter glacialis]|uniref:Cytochrome P450 n=1 Tax=Sandarakinorhabdus glacialis TaxID=1614636 RepID=A0A916ZTA8_9SPHN|nr:cytochrome P450 [Polymorphobacter glacialis]GGE13008.1 cytochrome P450 [Polymorphobacter glacialis]
MATAFADPVMPFPGFDRASEDNILVNPQATADGSVHNVYNRLRDEDPVHWCEPTGYRPFWAITRHADITTVSKANSRFINSKRTYLAPAEAEKWTLDTVGDTHLFRSLVDLDDPLHMKLRRLTHDWFLPANLRKLEPMISAVAKDHVDRMAAMGGECDFVNEVALFYPLRVIMRILGIPESDEPMMLRMTQELFGAQDPDVVARSKLITTGAGMQAGSGNPQVDLFQLAQEYFAYFGAITADRRANPRDDLSTIIANGMVDGAPIGDREAMSYYVITATAGHDTTSSTASGGLEQLIRNPEQLAKLKADPSLIPSAVEEMIRWVTPVKHFMRTASEDTELNGKMIRAGDGLGIFYWSGNRDERAFADPFSFKVDRSPNAQTAFGNGVHMCLGLHLARLEIRLLFAELLPRLESIALAGEPKNSIANFVSGLKTLPIKYKMR